MLTKTFTVHSAQATSRKLEVEHEGQKIVGAVPALVVEMTSDDDTGSHTVTFVGAAAKEAKDQFVEGGKVTITYTPA